MDVIMPDDSADVFLAFKEPIQDYLARHPDNISAWSFSAAFLWRDFFQFDIKKIRGALCVFARDPAGAFLYWPPLGSSDMRVAEECFEYLRDVNGGVGVSRIDHVSGCRRKDFPEGRFSAQKKEDEVVYLRSSVGALRGNLYKTRRAEYNQFARGSGIRFESYNMSMSAECCALYERWAAARSLVHQDDVYLSMLEDNRKVHKQAFQYARELGLVGRVVTVDGRIRAYTFGYPVNPQMFCVGMEVADVLCPGLPAYIFREFCRDPEVVPYTHINVMGSFGLDAVHQTKISYRPETLLPVFTVVKNE